MPREPLDRAVDRLVRNMAITQVSLHQRPPAALFALSVTALQSAVDDVATLLADTDSSRVILTSSGALGPATASLLADALHSEPTPDHIPDSWKD